MVLWVKRQCIAKNTSVSIARCFSLSKCYKYFYLKLIVFKETFFMPRKLASQNPAYELRKEIIIYF